MGSSRFSAVNSIVRVGPAPIRAQFPGVKELEELNRYFDRPQTSNKLSINPDLRIVSKREPGVRGKLEHRPRIAKGPDLTIQVEDGSVAREQHPNDQ